MKRTPRTQISESGFVLATVLVFLIVLSLVAFLAAKLTRSDIQIVNNLQNEKEAISIAEAGITEALYRVSVTSPQCVSVPSVTGPGSATDSCTSPKFDSSLSPNPSPTPPGGLAANSYHWGLSRSVATSTAQVLLSTAAPTLVSANNSAVPSLQPASLRQTYSTTSSGGTDTLKISWDVCTAVNVANGCSAVGAIRTYTKPVGTGEVAQPRHVLKIVSTGQSGAARRAVTVWAADITKNNDAGLVMTGSGCGDGIDLGNGSATINVGGTIAVNSGYTTAGPPQPCSAAVRGGNNNSVTATAINVVGQVESSGNAPTYTTSPVNNAGAVVDPYANVKPPCLTSPAASCASTLETGYSSYPPSVQNHSSNTNLPTSCTGTATAPTLCTISGGSSGSPVNINPGIYYGGLEITGYVQFAAGVYIMSGNGNNGGTDPNIAFDMTSGHTGSTGTGVMIYATNNTTAGCTPAAKCTYGYVYLGGGNTTIGITSSTTTGDPYYGILYYQDRADTNAVSMKGGNATAFNLGGAVYASNAAMSIVSGTNVNVNGLLVGKSLTMGGNGNLNVTPPNGQSLAGLFYRPIAWQDF